MGQEPKELVTVYDEMVKLIGIHLGLQPNIAKVGLDEFKKSGYMKNSSINWDADVLSYGNSVIVTLWMNVEEYIKSSLGCNN